MAAARTLVFALLVVAPAAAASGKAAPSTAAMETLRALDTDHTGQVEEPEVIAFARGRGLTDTNQVLEEFHSFDEDNSGGLDATELGNMLGVAADEVSNITPGPAPAALPVSMPTPHFQPQVDDGKRMTAPSYASYSTGAGDAFESNSGATAAVQAAETALREVRLAPAPAFAATTPIVGTGHGGPFLAATAPAATASKAEAATAASWLEASAHSAEQMASRSAAEMFAQQSAKALSTRGKEEEQAGKFEALAKSLREKERQLSSKVEEETRRAAQLAVQSAVKDTLSSLQQLEAQAQLADRTAATRRSQAHEARARAEKAQAALSASMQQLRGRP